MPKLKERHINFFYQPFSLTQPIHWSTKRFRALCCGRRFGKTTFAIAEAFNMSLDSYKANPASRPRGIIVAPTYDLVREDWRIAISDVLRDTVVQSHVADMWMDLGALGSIDFKSADRQGGVGRGAGYDWAVLDEAARIPREAWEDDLRPSLSDTRGRAVFISTPIGRNWFYDLWRKGQEPNEEIASWRYSTIDGWRSRFANDPIRLSEMEAEWERIVKFSSLKTLRQEYLAEFLEHEGQLFSLDKVIGGRLREAVPGRSYVAGLDPARVEDFMATAIFEVESRQLVGVFRSKHRAWDLQMADAVTLLKQYSNIHVLIDATGLGDPLAQDLMHHIPSVEAVKFTHLTKSQMVKNLSVAIDHGLIRLPDQPETQWLLDELRDYREYETTAHNIRYSAPEGKHDDGVTAVMLALWGMRFDLQQPQEDIPEFPKPRHPGEFTFEEFLDFTHRGTAWRKAYPHLEVPSHPWALAWEEHARWQRFMPMPR